jgi:cytoskeletal protein CcmA (bactofilin family)
VIGTLKASERVHIWSTGKLTGDMETRGIVIEDGAVLFSTVDTPQATFRSYCSLAYSALACFRMGVFSGNM